MTKEIISPITDQALPDKLSAEEAARQGHFVHSQPTPENSILLLIDHQIGLIESTRAQQTSELRDNILGLALTAKALGIPVLISSSNAQWQNGDTIPELKEIFPDEPIYRRTGIINAYADPTFRKAFDDLVQSTGRDHIIIAATTIGTCCTFPTLSMLNDGYQVFPVIDACGAWTDLEIRGASSRMEKAEAELVTVFSLACELTGDWKRPDAMKVFPPFQKYLPSYGYIIDSFWHNMDEDKPSDPFAQK